MHVIGLDLGGTKLAAALMTENGEVISRHTASLEGREGGEVGALVVSQLNRLRADHDDVTSVGISVPGIYYVGSGTVWAPNIRGWDDFPLRQEVQSVLEGTGISLAIDSDRACYILGETWKGAARGCRNAIYLAVGTGIGAGILIDGKILRGASDIAGAVGWMALKQPFRDEYARYGCFEYHASGEGLARVFRAYAAAAEAYDDARGGKSVDEFTTQDVFAAYDNNDPAAREVIEEAIAFWGMAVANLVSLFNPEKIIFGGGVFGPAVRFLDDIRREAAQWAQPISMKQVAIEHSQLGGEAGLLGTGKLALMAL